MAQQKLYTEEQVLRMLEVCRDSDLYEHILTFEDILKTQISIELPSDEEMGVIALKIADTLEHKLNSQEEAFYLAGFQTCAKWLKEQILNQNKQ